MSDILYDLEDYVDIALKKKRRNKIIKRVTTITISIGIIYGIYQGGKYLINQYEINKPIREKAKIEQQIQKEKQEQELKIYEQSRREEELKKIPTSGQQAQEIKPEDITNVVQGALDIILPIVTIPILLIVPMMLYRIIRSNFL